LMGVCAYHRMLMQGLEGQANDRLLSTDLVPSRCHKIVQALVALRDPRSTQILQSPQNLASPYLLQKLFLNTSAACSETEALMPPPPPFPSNPTRPRTPFHVLILFILYRAQECLTSVKAVPCHERHHPRLPFQTSIMRSPSPTSSLIPSHTPKQIIASKAKSVFVPCDTGSLRR